jgi:hypothetical protein
MPAMASDISQFGSLAASVQLLGITLLLILAITDGLARADAGKGNL